MPLHDACAATTLTSWHLLVTFCSLHVAQWVKLFEHKPFDSRTVMGFGILNGVSIGLLNLSLGFNSVGFYQMTKLAIIPCTVFLETVFLRKQFSKRIQLSLLMLLVGVGIATVTDMQLNLLGAVISLFTIVTTCVAQIVSLPMSIACKVLMMEVSFCELLQLSIFVMHILMSQFFRNLKALSARTVCRE
jgi:solute carrier family 35 protein E3